jgi:hypothetical protein
MANKADLISIYNTYVNSVIEENLGIGEPSDAPSDMPSHPMQPSGMHTISIPNDESEECDHETSHSSHEDSNLEMAKSEVYKILKSANELMNLLQCATSLEAWQLSKIVKASDYVCSVKGAVEYDEFEKCQDEMHQGMHDINNGMVVVSKIRDMLTGEDMGVNEEILKQVIFNIECLKESK